LGLTEWDNNMSEDIFKEHRRHIERETEMFNHGFKIGNQVGFVEGRRSQRSHQWNKLFWVVFTACFIGTTLAIILAQI
jgi:hypothetical protein